jgi:threonine/homoserine/homoserine lactone efflux protein
MIPESLINLWLAALPLIASPGPATLSIAAVAATYGLR